MFKKRSVYKCIKSVSGNFHNFARRETCKGCGEHKGETEVVQDRKQGVQPGDWGCGNVAFLLLCVLRI